MATNVTLPELGENIEKGTIAKVLVSKGDSIEKDQSIIEVETDKAVVEVPSTAAGTVQEVKVKDGDEIGVGDVIIVIGDGAAKEEDKKDEKEEPKEKKKKVEAKKGKEEEPEEVEEEAEPEPEEEPEEEEEPPAKKKVEARKEKKPAAKEEREDAEPKEEESGDEKREKDDEEAASPPGRYAASPSVRKLAREIGVDISTVRPADESGRITAEDVKAHARGPRPRAAASAGAEPSELPDFTRWGEVQREKMSTIRRRTAERLSEAWAAPHVTQNDKADITELETFRKKYGPLAERAGGKLTATAIVVKVLALALKKFPQFNASIDTANGEIVYKQYYNIGVAVDTDRGLLVPVIKDVDQKSIVELAVDLNDLSERARNRKVTLDEMQGGCITVTNLGSIGGVHFTPIINPPEVAILGVSRAKMEPVYENGQFVPRMMMPLSLSYDHRLIDGADAARFTRWVCEALEQPMLLFLES